MKKWIRFFMGIFLIVLFIMEAPGIILKFPYTKAMFDTIEEEEIQPDALFYSEEEATNTSEKTLKDQLNKH